ncbi:Acyl-CoA N-acyltransferases superfamily protein [Perilla frutescens var. hirtella]|uniref:Acyl-CoA N-acyltransferases superfamily protein n=1 Tax=Perilla frutescens var. hirtella TaxID=608512 RepID=A0AAD4PFM0_PERFH|nr:Acyl-CoA N-acyltransferases superfamily protein [Perilla frutescens var. hirtella]
MQMISCGGAIVVNSSILNHSPASQIKNLKHQPFSCIPNLSPHQIPTSGFSSAPPLLSGACRASQVAELFPTTSPEIVVREARIEDCWEVAETHCSSFFPEFSFPLDFVMRIDRLIGMLFGFSIPKGCRRTCLVAVTGTSEEEPFFLGSDDFRIGGFDGKLSLNKGHVAGILTVDTVADFLPRKGPLRQRRTGIAYISNVAVRDRFRRKGVATRLIAKAEAKAKSWGCRAVALHCDLNNPGATKLYTSRGFKCIEVPDGANWPQPKTSPEMQFNFMMKLLNSPNSSDFSANVGNRKVLENDTYNW